MRRPTQLSPALLVLLITTSLLSFVSGAVVWWIQIQRARDFESAHLSLQPWLTIHGWLNPVLAVLFGFMWSHHMRIGWRAGLNRFTGVLMAGLFAILILTGTGLYYSGSEGLRAFLKSVHQWSGLTLPLLLATHWVAGLRAIVSRK